VTSERSIQIHNSNQENIMTQEQMKDRIDEIYEHAETQDREITDSELKEIERLSDKLLY
jgi:ABC-type uncharacterized transport system ATPase subunit